nr:MAG TPA: hypothetical protein [Bacteriophage sp.]
MYNNHYPSLRIVLEIRSTFDSLHLLQIGCSYHISVLHVNLLKQFTDIFRSSLCVLQATLLQLCKYYKHVL